MPIALGKVTLREIEEHYSLCNLADLHDTIEAVNEVEYIRNKNQRK